jgi:hypothetical protein
VGGGEVNSGPREHSGRVSSFPHNLDGQAERLTRQAVSGGGGDSGGEGCQGRSRGVVDFDDARASTSAPSASTPHCTTTTVSLGFSLPPQSSAVRFNRFSTRPGRWFHPRLWIWDLFERCSRMQAPGVNDWFFSSARVFPISGGGGGGGTFSNLIYLKH